MELHNKLVLVFLMLPMLFFTQGCSDKDKSENKNDLTKNGYSPLVARSVAYGSSKATDVYINEKCSTSGGIGIYTGVDTNQNGTLDANEQRDTPLVICNGSTKVSIFSFKQVAVGDSTCANGGILIYTGLDLNNDDILNDNEILKTSPFCNKDDSIPNLSASGTITGTISTSSPSPSSAFAKAPGLKGAAGLFLLNKNLPATPPTVVADIDTTVKSMPKIIIKPISVKINADQTYAIDDLPSGEYELVYEDGNGNGKKLDNITLKPGSSKTANIENIKPTGSVKLKVVSLNTGDELNTSTVTLNGLDIKKDVNSSSELIFDSLPEGTYSLSVRNNNYVEKYISFTVTSSSVTDIGSVELNSKKGKLSGTVLVDGVKDLSNILVYAKDIFGTTYTTLTNSKGYYSFNSVLVGDGYSVVIASHDYEVQKVDNIDVRFSETSIAPAIKLTRLQTTASGSISGYARFNDRNTSLNHAGIIVSIEGTDYEAITSRDGSFILNNIEDGEHTLNFTDSNYITQTKIIKVVSGSSTFVPNVSLIVKKGNLSGKVLDDKGVAVSNATVTINTSSQTITTQTDANGQYTLNGVNAGVHEVKISKDGYDMGSQEVNIEAGATIDKSNSPIVIKNLLVVGLVSLGSSHTDHSGVTVTVLGTDIALASTDTNGNFSIYGLGLGAYQLLFTASGYVSQTKAVVIDVNTTNIDGVITMVEEVGSLSGTVDVPTSFGATDKLLFSVIDTSGNIVKESAVIGSGDFIVNGIGNGTAYTLRLSGTDTDGNTITTKIVTDINVSSGTDTKINDVLVVELTDKNPPVISSVNYDQNISINPYGSLVVNPSIYKEDSYGNKVLVKPSYINFEVIANDDDGDTLEYFFTADSGDIVLKNKNQMKWLAPEVGGSVKITFTAKSNARESKKVLSIAVNHTPTITLLSPQESKLKDDENILTQTSLDIFSFSASANDFENGDLSGDSVVWYSDLQGIIGKGTSINTTLKPGKHTITIKATDEQNLSKTTNNYFVQVNTPNEVLLKVPAKDIDYKGKVLSSVFDLNIVADELTLNYSSSDTTVASVATNGRITALATGASEILIESSELNELAKPLYSTVLVVRVVDSTDSTSLTNMKINQIYQTKVTDATIQEPFTFNNLKKGHYTLILFDEMDVVLDSRITSKIKKGTSDITSTEYSAKSYVLHTFEVSVDGDSYSLYLQPYSSGDDALVKVALYPGVDVRDVNGYINKTYWNNSFEPNDAIFMAKEFSLQNTVSTTLNKDDHLDYFYTDLIDAHTYTLEFENYATSYGNVKLYILDENGNEVATIPSQGEGKVISQSFISTLTGKVLIKASPYSSSYLDKYYKYSFNILPSTENGLVQDSVTFEPNNTPSTAYVGPELQTKFTSEITSDLSDKVDYISVNLVKDQTYTLEFENDATSYAYLNIYIIDSNDNVVDSINSQSIGDITSKSFTATLTGKFLVKVRPYSSGYDDKYFKYSFKILPSTENGLVQDSVTFEPNNTPSTAYVGPELQTKFTSEITSDLSDKVDYISVNLVKDQTYTLEFENDATSYANLSIHITDSNDYLVDRISNLGSGSSASTSFTATLTGKFLVKVEPYYATDDKYFKYSFTIK